MNFQQGYRPPQPPKKKMSKALIVLIIAAALCVLAAGGAALSRYIREKNRQDALAADWPPISRFFCPISM